MNQRNSVFLYLAVTFAVLCLAGTVRAEDWPQWRGPRGDGPSTGTGLPIKWGPGENVVWKTALPGKGHSSASIVGDRIFLTSCLEADSKHLVLCLDRPTGKILWTQEQPFKRQ